MELSVDNFGSFFDTFISNQKSDKKSKSLNNHIDYEIRLAPGLRGGTLLYPAGGRGGELVAPFPSFVPHLPATFFSFPPLLPHYPAFSENFQTASNHPISHQKFPRPCIWDIFSYWASPKQFFFTVHLVERRLLIQFKNLL